MKKQPSSARSEIEPAAIVEVDASNHVLRLYVAGMTLRSADAIARIKSVCEEYLAGRYDLEIVDIYQQPGLAKVEQIIAAPTLIKKQPLPVRRLVGDLSNLQRVLHGLNLAEA